MRFCCSTVLSVFLISVLWTIEGSVVDLINEVVWCLTIDGASNRLSRAKDLLHDSGKVLGHGSGPHDPGGVDDVVQSDVAIVLDVLDLLPVPGRFLEGLDDESRGRGNNLHLGLPVLDGEFDGDLESLPVLCGLGDVVTDLLWGQTQGTDLWGQSRGCGDLASNSTKADNLEKRERKESDRLRMRSTENLMQSNGHVYGRHP